jgi:hypothetical protein
MTPSGETSASLPDLAPGQAHAELQQRTAKPTSIAGSPTTRGPTVRARVNKLTTVRIAAIRWNGPWIRWMTITAGTWHVNSYTTTPSRPKIAWPACFFSSTPKEQQRSAA